MKLARWYDVHSKHGRGGRDSESKLTRLAKTTEVVEIGHGKTPRTAMKPLGARGSSHGLDGSLREWATSRRQTEHWHMNAQAAQ